MEVVAATFGVHRNQDSFIPSPRARPFGRALFLYIRPALTEPFRNGRILSVGVALQ
jgi:hypothetical protein